MILLIIASAVVGSIASYYLASLRSRQLLILIYHLPYRFWRSYRELYESFETKFTYEMIGRKNYKNHQYFLVQYNKRKMHVEERFKTLWNKNAYFIIRDYGLTLTVSMALFWNNYWAFIIPFVLVQTGHLIYVRFYKNCNYYLCKITVIDTVFSQ